MAIRWATPVARKTSQSARSIAFWSPVTSAAITPADRGSATRSKTASRTVSRKRSTGWRQVTAMRSGRGSRAPVRTWPVACTPCSHRRNSWSKPCGLRLPWGALSRTVMRQRSPACTGPGESGAPIRPHSPEPSAYQASETRRGTSGGSAVSTSNSKRTIPSPRWGICATTPTTCTSRPSSAGGSAPSA